MISGSKVIGYGQWQCRSDHLWWAHDLCMLCHFLPWVKPLIESTIVAGIKVRWRSENGRIELERGVLKREDGEERRSCSVGNRNSSPFTQNHTPSLWAESKIIFCLHSQFMNLTIHLTNLTIHSFFQCKSVACVVFHSSRKHSYNTIQYNTNLFCPSVTTKICLCSAVCPSKQQMLLVLIQ